MLSIFFKELSGFLNSLIAYVVIGVFLTSMGLLMWVFPESSILEYGYADMGTLFNVGPYIFMFLVPAITMRSFAEEKRTGTVEFLLTKPLTHVQIIIGKFVAGWVLVLMSLLPSLVYFYSVYQLGNPVGNLDISGTVGSYIGLCFVGAVFVAIGLLSSAVTDNQVVSFVLAVFLSFLLFSGLDSLSAINVWGDLSLWLKQMSLLFHYEAVSRGLIDLFDLVYFVGLAVVVLLLTKLVLDSRKW